MAGWPGFDAMQKRRGKSLPTLRALLCQVRSCCARFHHCTCTKSCDRRCRTSIIPNWGRTVARSDCDGSDDGNVPGWPRADAETGVLARSLPTLRALLCRWSTFMLRAFSSCTYKSWHGRRRQTSILTETGL
jgi:hypothetical protein